MALINGRLSKTSLRNSGTNQFSNLHASNHNYPPGNFPSQIPHAQQQNMFPGQILQQTFPSNRPPNMSQNALTNSGMIANSSNYALLQQLNMNMTPRNQDFSRPTTSSTMKKSPVQESPIASPTNTDLSGTTAVT